MSRREEVEYLAERIRNGIGSSSVTLRECAKESLDKLAKMTVIPARYTPREEVTEGWWSCLRPSCPERRQVIYVNPDGRVWITGYDDYFEIHNFTDFLPVPAWLVEGL